MPLTLAPIFHDDAVVQRDQPIPVWGTATPGQKVVVHLATVSAQVTAGPDGDWLLRLPPLPAGGPHELGVRCGEDTLVVFNVLVGEVWFCAGQSNMEWTPDLLGTTAETDGIDLPRVRLLTVTTPARLGRHRAMDGRWTTCTPQNLAFFSAVAGWFGRTLHAELDVPIGLINVAWGGTRIQAWMSREALAQDSSGREELRTYDAELFAPAPLRPGYATFEEWERSGAPQDQGVSAEASAWMNPQHDDAAWATMDLPAPWHTYGHPGSGIAWFRRTVQVPVAWAGQDLTLSLGAIDKHDDTWVNGELVGRTSWDTREAYRHQRLYPIPGRLIPADGRLTIAVRVRSHIYQGGLTGPATVIELRHHHQPSLPLTGSWRYRFEVDWGQVAAPATVFGAGNPNVPHTLFDSRVAPLIPFAIRGVLWYQGEANVDEARIHARQLSALIHDWRRAWGQGDFPFLQVQLANFLPAVDQPGPSSWALLREAQAATLALPGVGVAVAIDVGDAVDIHPKDKRSVGQRLARWALADTYHRSLVKSGPLLAGITFEAGGRLRCRFDHGAGLTTRDGAPVRHVALRDVHRRWHWATTAIEGDTLLAWLTGEAAPTAIRYAWADNPAGCNLVNGAGLPAMPFRSDDALE